MEIKIYKTYDKNILKYGHHPVGTLGDCSNESELMWSEPFTVDLPDEYTIAQNFISEKALYKGDKDCSLFFEVINHYRADKPLEKINIACMDGIFDFIARRVPDGMF